MPRLWLALIFCLPLCWGTAGANESPYWQNDESPARPYWEESLGTSNLKAYWEDSRFWAEAPYWQTIAEAGKARAPADATATEKHSAAVSYYAYRDQEGLLHLSDRQLDRRYQAKTLTVQIDIARGRFNFVFDQHSLKPYILAAAQKENLDPALIAAVIEVESAFDPRAVSWAGAQGLMQLMPQTARIMGCHDPFDPEANIMGGSRYLRQMLARFQGDVSLSLAAYNCGPERVKDKIPEIKETKRYVKKVLEAYQKYQGRL